MKQLSLLATLCILSVSSILEAIVDGTYSVTESWTVRIDYDNFAGGHSGTNTFTGSESGWYWYERGCVPGERWFHDYTTGEDTG
jgi:hypothetical protein